MMGKLLRHVRDQWMGALALFLVLASGTAYAANTVFSIDIVDGEVKTADLAGSAVTEAKLASGSVLNGKLKNDAVTSPKVLNETLVGGDVKDNALKGADIDESTLSSVGGGGPAGGDLTGTYPNPEIRADGVGSPEVAPDSLSGADIDESSLGFGCPAGFTAAGDICFDAPVETGADYATAQAACQTAGSRLPSVGEARLIQVQLGPPSGTLVLWTDDHASQSTAMRVFQSSLGAIIDGELVKTSTAGYACVRAPILPN